MQLSSLEAELANMRKANAVLLEQFANAAKQAPVVDDRMEPFRRAVPLALSDLPVASVPTDPDQLQVCGVLYGTLDRWLTAGDDWPFTWAELRDQAGTQVDASGSSLSLCLAKQMLGPAWTLLYGQADPGEDTVVSRKVVLALYRQLNVMKAEYDGSKDTQDRAAAHFAVMADNHHKRRKV